VGGGARYRLPWVYTYLGDTHQLLFSLSDAERCYRSALEAARTLKGEDHEEALQAKYRLGRFLTLISRPVEGLKLGKEAADLARRANGPAESFHASLISEGYGNSLLSYGRVEEGVAQIVPSMNDARLGKRVQSRTFARYLEEIADGETDLGHYRHATELLDEALKVHSMVGDAPPSAELTNAILTRARLLVATGDVGGAESVLRNVPAENDSGGLVSFRWLETSLAKGAVELAAGRYDDSVRRARDMRARLEASSQRTYFKRAEARAALQEGKGLVRMGHALEALPLLEGAVQLGTEIYDPTHSPVLADSKIALGACLAKMGRGARARTLLAEAKAIHGNYRELGEQFRRPLRDLEATLK